MTQIDQEQMERELFRAAHDGHDYACAKCGQGCGVMGHTDECPPPEVWRDDEYGECFWAWGRHHHAEMLIGAQACVDNGGAEGEWSNYEEAAKHSRVEYMLAYAHPEQSGNPRIYAHESWLTKPYCAGHGPDEEPVTKLEADPEW